MSHQIVNRKINNILYNMNKASTKKELFILNWKLFSYLIRSECDHFFSDSVFCDFLREKCNDYIDKNPETITFIQPLVEKYFFTDIKLCEKIKKINRVSSPITPMNMEIVVHDPVVRFQRFYYDTPKVCKCGRSFRAVINYKKHFCWI